MDNTIKKYSSGIVALNGSKAPSHPADERAKFLEEQQRNHDAGQGQQNEDDAETHIHLGSSGVSSAMKDAADENAEKCGKRAARVRLPA
jgi:hypothetical protein